jgi:hypothetical protein
VGIAKAEQIAVVAKATVKIDNNLAGIITTPNL